MIADFAANRFQFIIFHRGINALKFSKSESLAIKIELNSSD